MWAAIDVVKEQLGEFEKWPNTLKEAFSLACIDADQRLTAEELAYAQEVVRRIEA